MPGQIYTQAVTTVPAAMLRSEAIVGAIGEMTVVKAQIYGDDPARWGVFIRVSDEDAILICRYEGDTEDLQASLHHLGCLVFNTLHAAHNNKSALLSPHVHTDALLTDDTATVGSA